MNFTCLFMFKHRYFRDLRRRIFNYLEKQQLPISLFSRNIAQGLGQIDNVTNDQGAGLPAYKRIWAKPGPGAHHSGSLKKSCLGLPRNFIF